MKIFYYLIESFHFYQPKYLKIVKFLFVLIFIENPQADKKQLVLKKSLNKT